MRGLRNWAGFAATVIGLAAPLIALGAVADTESQYMALRSRYHIAESSAVDALNTFVGTRVMEISGTITGSITVNNQPMVLVERTDGDTQYVLADDIPNWLDNNATPCRIILRAYRASTDSSLKCRMLGVISESEIAPIEQAQEEARSRQTRASRQKPTMQLASNTPRKSWTLPTDQVAPYYAAFIRKDNPKLTPAQAMHIANGIIDFSVRFGVDARLIMAIVMTESDFDPACTSNKGAMGLGQLMPTNAQDLGLSNAYNTTENLYGTVKLVRQSLETYRNKGRSPFEDLVLALAAYNAGDGAVKRYGGVPPYRETQGYVRKVTERYRRFCGEN